MNKVVLPVLAMGLVGLSACGPLQQDPLEKYPLTSASKPVNNPDDLRRIEPEVRERIVIQKEAVDRPVYYPKEVEQNYAAAQLFQITSNQSLSFVAGVEAKIPFEVRILQGEVAFNAVLADLPGARLDEVAAEKNKKSYVLTFKPSVDMIAGNSREQTGILKITLNVGEIKAETADKKARLQQAFEVVSRTKPFEYTLRRDYRNPKLDVVGFPASLEEGGKQEFSIQVTAPGTYAGYQPELIVDYDNKGLNGNIFENSGAPFVVPSSTKERIQKTGDGTWVFNYEVNTTRFAVPAQVDKNMQRIESADGVQLRVRFKVVSPQGTTSDDRVVQYKIVYKKAAPVVAETTADATKEKL